MPERRRHVHEETKEASQLIRVSAADLEQAWHRRPALGWNISKSASQLKSVSAADLNDASTELHVGNRRPSTAEAASELLLGSPRYPMRQ